MVGSHTNGDFAAVYVLTEEELDWLSVVQRDDGGWTELTGGQGGFIWINTDDDEDEDSDLGVVACAVPVDAPGDYLVRYADGMATVRAQEPYVVAVLLGVVAVGPFHVTRLGGDGTATQHPE